MVNFIFSSFHLFIIPFERNGAADCLISRLLTAGFELLTDYEIIIPTVTYENFTFFVRNVGAIIRIISGLEWISRWRQCPCYYYELSDDLSKWQRRKCCISRVIY